MTLLILTGLPVLLCDLASRPTFFNIYLPASDSDKATRISQTLRITLSECPLQIGRLNTLAPCVAENRER